MMTEEKKEIYARAMEKFLQAIDDYIEDKAIEMVNNGEYFEYDGDNGRPEYCRPLTKSEARESALDSLIYEYEQSPVLYSFLDFCAHEVNKYHVMDKSNSYHSVYLD